MIEKAILKDIKKAILKNKKFNISVIIYFSVSISDAIFLTDVHTFKLLHNCVS